MTTFQDVAAYIGQATRAEIDSIFNLGNARAKAIRMVASTEALASIKPGDRVKIAAGIRPQYLVGATGVVTDHPAKRAGSLSVVLDRSVGKFPSGFPIGVAASCLTKVDA
jgi:hypothetical protein